MSLDHVHSFRKVAGKLYCTSATCFKKFSYQDVQGKLIRCPLCKSLFIYDQSAYGLTDLVISCNQCSKKGPWELTLETQKSMLGDIILENFQKDFQKKELYLKDYEHKLDKLQLELGQESKELEIRRDQVIERELRTRHQRIKIAGQLRAKKLELKLWKKKTGHIREKLPDLQEISQSNAGEVVLEAIGDMLGVKP